ncbi:hypothetical protein Q9189_004390 [Teloschistes chrysophthalmus]
MASQEEYWTWDSRVGNFYHPEWNGRTRTLHDPWPLGPSPAVILLLHETMLTCPQEPGNIHGHLAIQALVNGAVDVASRNQSRPTVYEHRGPRPRGYSSSYAHGGRPLTSLGSVLANAPESSRAAENRRAQDVGYSPQNAIEPLPAYEDEVSPGHVPTGRPIFGARLDPSVLCLRHTSISFADILPEYQVMKKPHEYFVEGTVFSKLHTEEAGSTSADFNTFGFSTVIYDGRVYSQLRRFVVVMPKPKELFCLCVPITTYSGKGTMKKGVDKNAHTIIYTGNQVPRRLPEEKGMNKAPLKVIPVGPEEMLDPMSRINIGKPYPVDWNNKVKPIGHLDHSSRLQLRAYWKELVNAS